MLIDQPKGKKRLKQFHRGKEYFDKVRNNVYGAFKVTDLHEKDNGAHDGKEELVQVGLQLATVGLQDGESRH